MKIINKTSGEQTDGAHETKVNEMEVHVLLFSSSAERHGRFRLTSVLAYSTHRISADPNIHLLNMKKGCSRLERVQGRLLRLLRLGLL